MLSQPAPKGQPRARCSASAGPRVPARREAAPPAACPPLLQPGSRACDTAAAGVSVRSSRAGLYLTCVPCAPHACRALLADVQAAIMRGEDAQMNRCAPPAAMPPTHMRSRTHAACLCTSLLLHCASSLMPCVGAGASSGARRRPCPCPPPAPCSAAPSRSPRSCPCVGGLRGPESPLPAHCHPAPPLDCLQLPMDGVAAERRRAPHVRRRARAPADCDDSGACEHGAEWQRGAGQPSCLPACFMEAHAGLPSPAACAAALCLTSLLRALHAHLACSAL